MVTKTLTFESGRFLESLFAGDQALLREAGVRFGVGLVARDCELMVQGAEEGGAEAEAFFIGLEKARREGLDITAPIFRLALDGEGGAATGCLTF